MGIEPRLFGPSFWGAIHYAALGAPDILDETHKLIYMNFYKSLPQILPCSACGQHFAELLQEIPINPYLNTSERLFEWTVIAHNVVNKRLNKPELTVSDAKNKWMQLDTIKIKSNKNNDIRVLRESHMPDETTQNSNLLIELLLKCIIILFVFGGGIYIGSVLFTKKPLKIKK